MPDKAPAAAPQVQLCRFFAGSGCREGDKCRFRHPADPPPATSPDNKAGPRKPRARKKSNKSAKWWHALEEDDPITLEPVRELSYEPFKLNADESVVYYFDGRVLANYLISSSNFVHPVSRRALGREECVALDEYLTTVVRMKRANVTKVFDHSLEAANQQSEHITELREEARVFVESLFQFGAATAGPVTAPLEERYTMIDDDEVVAMEAESQESLQEASWPVLEGGTHPTNSSSTQPVRERQRVGTRATCWVVTDSVAWDVHLIKHSAGGCVEACGDALRDPANEFVYVSLRGDRPELLSARWRSIPKDTFATRVDLASQAQVEALASVGAIPGALLVEYKRLGSDGLESGFRVRVLCSSGAPDYGSVPKLKLLDRKPAVRPPPASSALAAVPELQVSASVFVPQHLRQQPEEACLNEEAAESEEPQEASGASWEQTRVDDYGNPQAGDWIVA